MTDVDAVLKLGNFFFPYRSFYRQPGLIHQMFLCCSEKTGFDRARLGLLLGLKMLAQAQP